MNDEITRENTIANSKTTVRIVMPQHRMHAIRYLKEKGIHQDHIPFDIVGIVEGNFQVSPKFIRPKVFGRISSLISANDTKLKRGLSF
jgi:hypothetical protein